MATLKIVLRKDKTDKAGKTPLYLRITKDRKHRWVSLGYKIEEKHWDAQGQRVRKSYTNSQRLNNYLAQKRAEAEGAALELESKDKHTRGRAIKEKIMGKLGTDLFEFAEKKMARLVKQGKFRQQSKIKSAMNKLEKYLGTRSFFMDELNYTALKEYMEYMELEVGNSPGTIYCDMSEMRALYNEAIKLDLFPHEKNPFKKLTLRVPPSKHPFLSEEELSSLENLETKPGSKEELVRDMFVFACYAGGIRFGDLIQLREESFDGDRICWKAGKTNEVVCVQLSRKAKEVWSKYASEIGDRDNPTNYVFPILKKDIDALEGRKKVNQVKAKNQAANAVLKEIQKMAGIKKKLHFHMSRHTFATMALRLGVRLEYVSKLMGHKVLKTTQGYAKIQNNELDDAIKGAFD